MGYIFNGLTKIITLTPGTNTLSVKDVYSRWKDWAKQTDNTKFLKAFDSIGGEDIDTGSGTKIPPYVFLKNGWRIKPQEADHTLNVIIGILLVEGGGDPFINTSGNFVVRINYQQPVQAITIATGGSGGSISLQDIRDALLLPASIGASVQQGSIDQKLKQIQNTVVAGL